MDSILLCNAWPHDGFPGVAQHMHINGHVSDVWQTSKHVSDVRQTSKNLFASLACEQRDLLRAMA